MRHSWPTKRWFICLKQLVSSALLGPSFCEIATSINDDARLSKLNNLIKGRGVN